MEKWQVVFKGEVEFEGTRQECSIYLLNHGLSRYYRGTRVLNLGVELRKVPDDGIQTTPQRQT